MLKQIGKAAAKGAVYGMAKKPSVSAKSGLVAGMAAGAKKLANKMPANIEETKIAAGISKMKPALKKSAAAGLKKRSTSNGYLVNY